MLALDLSAFALATRSCLVISIAFAFLAPILLTLLLLYLLITLKTACLPTITFIA